MVNGLIYLSVGLTTGRFRKKLLPITPEGVISDTKAALTGKLSHDDLSKYNQVQKLLYAGIIVVGILIVLSGLSIWKPVQLQYLTALFGGYDAARMSTSSAWRRSSHSWWCMSRWRCWCRRACAP